MNITLAHTLLQERGYSLELRDVTVRGRQACYIYAKSTTHEHLLCSMSLFIKTSTNTFRYWVARLETEQ